MNHKKGISLVAAGVVLACATLLGVFAAISDTADTGTLSVESEDLAASIELKIADHEVSSSERCTDPGAVPSASYVDDQTIDLLTLADANPGSTLTRYVCVKNEGAQPAVVSLDLLNTADVETGCTGDEADTDATCGTGAGELADDVDVTVTQIGPADTSTVGCNETAQTPAVTYDGVADSTASAALGGTIPGGAFACYQVVATYDAATPAGEVTDNQTDQVTWQHRFHGEL